MGKKILIGVLVAALLAAAGYWAYTEYAKPTKVSLWTLVPSTATAVYETKATADAYQRLTEKDLWLDLAGLPLVNNLQQQMDSLLGLAPGKELLSSALANQPVLVSIHRTSSTDWGYLLLLRLGEGPASSLASKVISHFIDQEDYTLQRRNYRDLVINQVSKKGSESVFSYLVYQGYFVGSFTPFLVEDVIRTALDEKVTFLDRNPDIFSIKRLEDDYGNLYVDLRQLESFRALFAKEAKLPLPHPLKMLGTSATLDINLSNDALLLNGFTTTQADSGQFLETLRGQPAGRFTLAPFLPLRSSQVLHIHAPRVNEWFLGLERYAKTYYGSQYREKLSGLKQISVDPAPFRQALSGQVAQVTLQSVDPSLDQRLLVMELKDEGGMKLWLETAVQNMNRVKGTEVPFVEEHQGVEIGLLDMAELPSILFFGQFSGFESCYYAFVKGALIFSNSLTSLKTSIADISLQNTWDKSVSISLATENLPNDANLSYYFVPDRGQAELDQALSEPWLKAKEAYSQQLGTFDFFATQFTWLAGKFYTSVALHYGASQPAQPLVENVNVLEEGTVSGNLVRGPWIERSHVDRTLEAFAQDSRHVLHFFSSTAQPVWSWPLDSALVGPLHPLDFYKNGKKQYLAITQDSLWLIDRNGNMVSDFPKGLLQGFDPTMTSVIDYDNSKRYRICLTDKEGVTYLLDKEGAVLDGWNPLLFGGALQTPVKHIRIGNKDVLFAFQQDGTLNVVNRQGKNINGFPVELGEAWRGDYFLQPGPSLARSTVTLITQSGMLTKFNLAGQVEQRKQLYKATSTSNFQLIYDALGKDFVVVRQDPNMLTVLDMNGEEVYGQPMVTGSHLHFQYYHFSPENRVLAVNDPKAETTTLLNQVGKVISGGPINSSDQIGLLYFEQSQSFLVYTIYQDAYRKLSIGN